MSMEKRIRKKVLFRTIRNKVEKSKQNPERIARNFIELTNAITGKKLGPKAENDVCNRIVNLINESDNDSIEKLLEETFDL